MACMVTRKQGDGSKLFIRRIGEDLMWTPARSEAAIFDEPEAEKVSKEINDYASVLCEVTMTKAAPEAVDAEQARAA